MEDEEMYDGSTWIDDIIKEYGNSILLNDISPHILDPLVYRRMATLHDLLLRIFDGSDVSVSYKMQKPFKGSGSVSIQGSNIDFAKSDLLTQAVKLADNMDVYPMIRGVVRIDFGFHGLAKVIK